MRRNEFKSVFHNGWAGACPRMAHELSHTEIFDIFGGTMLNCPPIKTFFN